jgi:hypothetical protein
MTVTQKSERAAEIIDTDQSTIPALAKHLFGNYKTLAADRNYLFVSHD